MIFDKQVVILGAGNMGGALLGGIRRANLVPPDHLLITGLRKEHLEALAGRWGVRWTTNNVDAVQSADIIILCLKPQAIASVLAEISDHLSPTQLLISIAAGITTSLISKRIGQHNPVVRVMPTRELSALVPDNA